jgi:hypothetical protein
VLKRQIGLGIEGRTPFQDAVQVFHRLLVAGHGAHVTLRRHAGHVVGRVGLQPDGVAVRQQQVEVGRIRHQAAGRGDHHLGVDLDRLFQRAALVAAVGVAPYRLWISLMLQPANFSISRLSSMKA